MSFTGGGGGLPGAPGAGLVGVPGTVVVARILVGAMVMLSGFRKLVTLFFPAILNESSNDAARTGVDTTDGC